MSTIASTHALWVGQCSSEPASFRNRGWRIGIVAVRRNAPEESTRGKGWSGGGPNSRDQGNGSGVAMKPAAVTVRGKLGCAWPRRFLGPPTPDDLDRLPQPALDLAPVAHLAVSVVDPVLRWLLREMAMPFGDLGVARRAQHRRLPQLRRPIIAERSIFGASALGAFEIGN